MHAMFLIKALSESSSIAYSIVPYRYAEFAINTLIGTMNTHGYDTDNDEDEDKIDDDDDDDNNTTSKDGSDKASNNMIQYKQGTIKSDSKRQ